MLSLCYSTQNTSTFLWVELTNNKAQYMIIWKQFRIDRSIRPHIILNKLSSWVDGQRDHCLFVEISNIVSLLLLGILMLNLWYVDLIQQQRKFIAKSCSSLSRKQPIKAMYMSIRRIAEYTLEVKMTIACYDYKGPAYAHQKFNNFISHINEIYILSHHNTFIQA